MLQILDRADAKSLASIREEKAVRKTQNLFILFAMGSQFDRLIQMVFERLGWFCLVANPGTVTAEDIAAISPTGMVISGGPGHAHTRALDPAILELGIPVLGICYGCQLLAKASGCEVSQGKVREFGPRHATLTPAGLGSLLFDGCPETMMALMNHGDVVYPSPGIETLATTKDAPVAAARFAEHLYGVLFHPEVEQTTYGDLVFDNFAVKICRATDRFPAEDVALQKIEWIRSEVGNRKVLALTSGGTDSSTVAELLAKALLPEQVVYLYIDGIGRIDDRDHVLRHFGNRKSQLVVEDATEEFLKELNPLTKFLGSWAPKWLWDLAYLFGYRSMPKKRLAMQRVYDRVVNRVIRRLGNIDWVAQGTLYPDLAESGAGLKGAEKSVIKKHHNVGNNFLCRQLLPLKDCVKQSGRNIGRAVGVSKELLMRHPFPGPGMVVRIEGVVTPEKLRIARHADEIYIGELRARDLYDDIWQAGAVVMDSMTTCNKGDGGVMGRTIELWAFDSVTGFTATPFRFPDGFLEQVAQRITDEIREVGSVSYNISGKPPRTIERG